MPLVEGLSADVITTTDRSNVAGLCSGFLDDLEAPVLQSELFVFGGHEKRVPPKFSDSLPTSLSTPSGHVTLCMEDERLIVVFEDGRTAHLAYKYYDEIKLTFPV